jgi:mono/diheme cytochrome c family protein
LQNGSFWSAFFNPTYWPALLFRFGLSLCLAGMFGLITAGAIKHEDTRETMVRFCAQWICLPFVLMLLGAIWYVAALPEDIRALMQRATDDIRPFVRSFLDAAPVLFLAGMFLFIRLPRKAYPPYVAVVLVLGLISAGSFEFIRETSRRPWLIYGHMYSNGITAQDGQRMNAEGILATSGWARLRGGLIDAAVQDTPGTALLSSLSPPGRAQFGRFIYLQQCSSCHGLGGPRLDLLPRVKGRGAQGVAALLAAQGIISAYMPPFFGTDEERLFFAQWLAELETIAPE